MKFRNSVFLILLVVSGFAASAFGQVDSVIGQVTQSISDSYVGGISADGRLIVFESNGNIATYNPRNSDGNREIFIFDYAQRQIFQLTDTKSLLADATKSPSYDNIKVDIINVRPTITPDGKFIVFGSNATTSTPTSPNSTNPGSFDANSFTGSGGANPLTSDGNTELWIYELPTLGAADLRSGDEIALTDLSSGAFTRVTNTAASRLPAPGAPAIYPTVADDNRDPSVSDTGSYIAFTSNRDLVAGGNSYPSDDNDEIFVFIRSTSTVKQVTRTGRGTVGAPIYNMNPTVSGNGLRVMFMSNANNPIIGMTGGANSDLNEEIFYADLDGSGNTTGPKVQVTNTARTSPSDVINVLSFGKRMSRNGRYLAFDSYADLANEHGGAKQAGFATFLYDATLTSNQFRRIGPRSTADSAAIGGDLARYPAFTDYDGSGNPSTLVLETRMNIKPDGTIPTTASEGLNPSEIRPPQVYSYPLTVAPSSATFTRLTKLADPLYNLPSVAPVTTDSLRRMTFSLAQIDPGTGNYDYMSEVYYLYIPQISQEVASNINFTTGASRYPVTLAPSPTPTVTPSPSPSPTASPSPSPSPSPTASPTPISPPSVVGLSPGMLAELDLDAVDAQPIVARTAAGSLNRSFELPMELSGLTMTIGGASVGLKYVSRRTITFVVPRGLASAAAGTNFPVVINNNGIVYRTTVTIVPARPDIFTNLPVPGPGGRVKVFNVTNRIFTTEPFTNSTFSLKGSRRVNTKLRIYATGIESVAPANVTVRIGGITIAGAAFVSNVTRAEPGVYFFDIEINSAFSNLPNTPVVIGISVGGEIKYSRLESAAPLLSIL